MAAKPRESAKKLKASSKRSPIANVRADTSDDQPQGSMVPIKKIKPCVHGDIREIDPDHSLNRPKGVLSSRHEPMAAPAHVHRTNPWSYRSAPSLWNGIVDGNDDAWKNLLFLVGPEIRRRLQGRHLSPSDLDDVKGEMMLIFLRRLRANPSSVDMSLLPGCARKAVFLAVDRVSRTRLRALTNTNCIELARIRLQNPASPSPLLKKIEPLLTSLEYRAVIEVFVQGRTRLAASARMYPGEGRTGYGAFRQVLHRAIIKMRTHLAAANSVWLPTKFL